jgi:hypothetical protein
MVSTLNHINKAHFSRENKDNKKRLSEISQLSKQKPLEDINFHQQQIADKNSFSKETELLIDYNNERQSDTNFYIAKSKNMK